MAETAPADIGDRYAAAAADHGGGAPAAATDLPPAVHETVPSATVMAPQPTLADDTPTTPESADQLSTPSPTDGTVPTSVQAKPHVAPGVSSPAMIAPATMRSVLPGRAPTRLPAKVNDPFQADDQLHGPPAGAVPLAAPKQTQPAGIALGTGLPGTADLEGPQAPSLTLEKRAPAEIQVGKECTFEIRIRNTGHVAAHGVVVRDEIPQKTSLVTCQPRAAESAGGVLHWELGTLNVGEEVTIEMRLLPMAEGEVGSVATVEFRSRVSVRTIVTKPELAVRLSGPPTVMIGDEVPLEIEISNPGSGAATGVILLEDVPAGLSHPAGDRLELELGTIPPGEQRQLRLVLTATKAGAITNLLTARADANLSVDAHVDIEVIAPQLKVGIDGPKRRFLERPATYTLSLENPGTAAAKDVELAAYLPKGMKFLEANNHGQYDAATHSVIWGLEELPASERGSVQLVAVPVEPGDQMLRAEGRAAKGLTDQAKQGITVEGVAAIKFAVDDLEDAIEIGGETTYKIDVVNEGSKAATQVQIAALIPAGLKAVAASGPSQHAMQADRVVFAPLRRLAPKAEVTYEIRVEGLDAGDHRLRVQLATDEIRQPVTKEENTRVYPDE
jgi:uncharacterized repeat protein (TIGR01451 family)